MESGMIDVNHTLVYYDHRTEGSKSGCYFNVNTTKTPASMRQVPMLGTKPHSTKQSEELSVIAMMSRFLHSDEPDVLLPHFSCHSLRHTFTTRMCEAGVNIKVIQDALGHSDISTTLNIYADVTKEMKAEEFKGLDSYFKV